MHAAEQPDGRFYRPASISPPAGASDQQTLPAEVREAIWNFLRHRVSLLMSAPGLDMKDYFDHPREHELSDGELAEAVCSNHYANAHGWPHRWSSIARRFGGGADDVQGQAYATLNRWHRALKHDASAPRLVIDEIGRILDRYYFGADLNVALHVRQPKNAFGHCVEDIEYRQLRTDLPEDVAAFMVASHNALITVLAWLDRDLAMRHADAAARQTQRRRERELEEKIDALLEREARHARAVKKVKTKLAKEREDVQRLRDEAERRMAEAMAMAALAQRAAAPGPLPA